MARVRRDSLEPGRVEAAQRLADRLLAMVELLGEGAPVEHFRLVQLAVRYFVTEDDAQDDRGAAGFVDDEEVVAAVELALE